MLTDRIFSNPATALGVYKYKLQLELIQNNKNLRHGRDFRNNFFHTPNFIA